MPKPARKNNRLYTTHGEKKNQGILIMVNGKTALGYFEGENVVGYTFIDEINKFSYTKELPEYELDF